METESLINRYLPIIVGITGHRDIPPEYVAGLEEQAEADLLRLQKQYPHCPVIVLSSLADGADRLGARAALKAGCSLRVPLPIARDEYEKDFDETSRREFSELLSRSDGVFVVDAIESMPEDTSRGYFYRQAGLYIAKHAHILIALWDGVEALYSEGGGTFETVDFMRRENGIIRHIPTLRMSNPDAHLLASETVDLQNDKRLAAIEEFNRTVEEQKERLNEMAVQSKPYVIDADTEKNLGGCMQKLLHTFLYADALSIRNRDFKLLTLRLLSALGLLLVLAFLLYDEMESDLMLFVYGAVIFAAGMIYIVSNRRDFHGKYITYRALAEALRVQFYWELGGVSENACEHYTYTQKSELDFVRFVMRAIETEYNGLGEEPIATNCVCVCRFWINGQQSYHSASAMKKGRQDRRNTSAAKFMLILSVLLFAAVVVMELFFKTNAQKAIPINDTLRDFLLMHSGQDVIWRGILKIALGAVSAGTAFLANYYGSLSLPQQIFDNQRMHALFESVLHVNPNDKARFDETVRMIGRESLIESAAWYVMQRDNAQKFFL